MAYTVEDLVTIERAVATGERRVAFADGRSVEYRSVEELKTASTLIREELAAADAIASGTRRSRFARLYQRGDGR